MPATDWGWLVTPCELRSWIIEETNDWLVVNKPGLVVCHPSKRGPWSSLIGACREYLGVDRLHLVFRLDRETSGVVVLAKNAATASELQRAMQARQVQKTYWAILCGELREPCVCEEPIGRDLTSAFASRQRVHGEYARCATTEFVPLAHGSGFTLARVHPRTGRLHQIRVHAAWLGLPVAGDKLYPDATPMLEFVEHGFTPGLAAALPLNRHALHAAEVRFELNDAVGPVFRAPLAEDLLRFCREKGLNPPE
jgi:23S rRNA pseudouridine1911/1915/1917 synthase